MAKKGPAPNELNKELIHSRCIPEPNSGCWLWLLKPGPHGYGRVCVANEDWLAHRASFTVFRGPIPRKHGVFHTCDNVACVNPDHLFTGLQRANVEDMITKGRSRTAFQDNKCRNGHDMTSDGAVMLQQGKRLCRVCYVARKRVYNADYYLRTARDPVYG